MSVEFEEKVLKILGSFEEKFDTLNSKVDILGFRMNSLESRMDSFELKLTSFESRMDSMEQSINQKIQNIENDVQSLKKSVILIENQVTTEIPALFDVYSMQQEMQECEHTNIVSLNKKVEEHDIRLSCLEQKLV